MPVVDGDTFSLLAPVLGPELNNSICHPPPLFTAASMIRHVLYSSVCCLRHSWLTQRVLFCLNQPVGKLPPSPNAVLRCSLLADRTKKNMIPPSSHSKCQIFYFCEKRCFDVSKTSLRILLKYWWTDLKLVVTFEGIRSSHSPIAVKTCFQL